MNGQEKHYPSSLGVVTETKELIERLDRALEFVNSLSAIGAMKDAASLLASQAEEIERLRASLKATETERRALSFDSDRECRASARLACQFARALEALKPFAEIPEADVGTAAHYWVVIGTPDKSHFTREDLRRARSVLQSSSDRKSPDE